MAAESKVIIRAIDKFSKVFKELRSESKKHQKSFKKLGKASKAVGIAMAGGFALGIKDAAKFESALSNIGTLLDGDVNGQLKELENGIREISRVVPKDPNELGAAAYDVVSAGIQGTANQLRVLESSARLAVTGLGSTKEATDLVTSSINAFGYEAKDSEKVASILFGTVKAGKTTISELSGAFGNVAPIAKSAGVSFEELQAATAAITTTGTKASMVQNNLKSLFNEMTKASGPFADALKQVGIENVNTAIEADGFVSVLEKVKDELNLTDTEFKNLMGSQEAQAAALSLVGEQNEVFRSTLGSLSGDTTAMDEAFRLQSETLNNELIVALNNTKEAFSLLAKEAMPIITDAINLYNDTLGKLLETYAKVKEATSKSKEATEGLEEAQKNYNITAKLSEGVAKQNSKVLSEFYDMLIDNQKLATKEAKEWAKGDTEAAEKIQSKRKELAAEISQFATENSKSLGAAEHGWGDYSFAVQDAVEGSSKALSEQINDLMQNSIKERKENRLRKEAFEETAKTIMQSSEEGALNVETATALMAAAWETSQMEISSSVSTIASETSEKMQEPANSASTWGSHLLSNFIAGIKSKFPSLSGAIGEVQGIVNNLMGFSTNPYMPTEIYGEHMVQNFASGAVKATPRVQAAMGEIITIVNAFGQEVQVGVNDTAGVFEAYATKVDDAKKSHEDLASEAGKAMASMTSEIQAGVAEASQSLSQLKQDLSDIFGEFGEKEQASKEKFAQAVVENEKRIADIQKEIREEEDEAKKSQLLSELEREQLAREQNLELIKSVEKEATEIKRFNNLTRLQQSVEVFQKEREENKKWLQERLESYNQELDTAKEKLPELEGLWEERRNLLTQYMGDEIGKSEELNSSIDRSIYQIRILMEQLNALDRKSKDMGIGIGSLGLPKNRREKGGPVSSNSSYLVGERGPERFTPSQGGYITPNNAMGGGITININGPVSSEEAAEEMMDVVVRRLQQHVKVV